MLLELDKLVEFWGDKQMTPMLLIDEEDNIEWCNRWAVWLFQVNLKKKNLRQLPAGERLAEYAARVREYNAPFLTRAVVNGLNLDVEGRPAGEDSPHLIFKFHTRYMSRPTMLEMHKFMQDFALEAGDRVNNPLTTVLNCLNMIQRDLRIGKADKLETYVELAIREAHVMKEFGDWVRRLSEEPPFREEFDLVRVLEEVLDRRGCLHHLAVQGEVPPVRGSAEHAAMVLGGLVNLMRQASNKVFTVKVACLDGRLVTVEINSPQGRGKDLRMLSEECYGGLGLLAARYLLSLMQAQLELEFMGDIGVRVTFISAGTEV
ncbi:MAG: hypothetical protein ACOX2G_11875 [Bacillota bacterium]|jgi:hypothetical protein